MRILFVVDARSPIALNWIHYWIRRGDDVHVVSTFPCEAISGVASLKILPVAFSGVQTRGSRKNEVRPKLLRSAETLHLRQLIRHWIGPLMLKKPAKSLYEITSRTNPDIIHAMRIPYEGMLAATVRFDQPLIISVWGNDFTLHAPSTPFMAMRTRMAMQIAEALHVDCKRDMRLAKDWGFTKTKPILLGPGNGGVHREIFHPPPVLTTAPIVLNPRGFRAYVRNDIFFQALPYVLSKRPDAQFTCSAMAGESKAEKWITSLNLHEVVTLLDKRPHEEMGDVYRSAAIMVSPSTHDGTPNTLLEAMASGCFPIVGDIESMHEWITAGVNGQIINPTDQKELAEAILLALEDFELRKRAADINYRIISERADYVQCMRQAEEFYLQICS